MSITRESIFAPQPSTTRATPTPLSVDSKGERIAYASGKSVFLRSIDNPSISTQYTGHTAAVNVARISPTGYYVASGDAAGTVRVWDCVGEDKITKGEFHIISGPIKDLAWDGESKRIIAVGNGKERYGHCITFDTGNSVGEISGHSSAINSVSIRQSRPYRAATASDDHAVVFYHGAPFKFNTGLNGNHSNFVHGVAFSPDGEYFVSVGADRKIFLYNGKTGEHKNEIVDGENGHKGSILSVSWSPDSKRFVTASADQTVKLWDVESGKNTHTWTIAPEGSPPIPHHQVGVVWTPRSDNLIISLSLSGDLNYLNESSTEPIRIVSGHQKAITALKVVNNNPKALFTGSYEGRVCKWDLTAGTALTIHGEGHTNTVNGFVSMDSDGVASVGWDDRIRRIDDKTGKFLDGAFDTESQPKGVSPIGSAGNVVIATVSEIAILLKCSEKIASLKPKFTPTSVAASISSDLIFAIGGQDNKVHVYQFSGSAISEKQTLDSSRAPITSLSYSPDAKLLAVGDSSGKIILYDAAAEYAVKTTRWAFHTARVEGIAWNDAGTHVVSGSLDTNLFVYSVENPTKNLKAMNAHMGGVSAVGWESDGMLVSSGADGSIKRWIVKLM